MAEHLQETFAQLTALAKIHSRVAVGFSGGKDSLATLDLACKHFETVIPYFYYFVPGLKSEEAKLSIAKDRYGLEVLHYPSISGLSALQLGLFCDEVTELDALPQMSKRTLFDWIKADTRTTLVLDGDKKSDGIFRRRRMASQKNTMADIVHPLKDWLKWEVLSYLKAQGIPIPPEGRGDNGCMSLLNSEILQAYDHHREDYETLRGYFPYIEVVVKHRQWFGAPA